MLNFNIVFNNFSVTTKSIVFSTLIKKKRNLFIDLLKFSKKADRKHFKPKSKAAARSTFSLFSRIPRLTKPNIFKTFPYSYKQPFL